ncbi:Dauer Up-Regulated [Caenorhabditis elegans]|uniref:Dauer Up-Regulated n=1 Tax=Caenorhabditis elegans TaxID=6239 RepID=Q9XV39_CAEEL|nr:Dauer Up-Regulated [Caenorhabditis elegans]CAB04308.2 Dauer Up-Regulated [Caenorhabditis elegans]|eukprot:NP_492893.2 Uncharacterized protein CELE_F36D1.5 [Caenorhabditis elegans]
MNFYFLFVFLAIFAWAGNTDATETAVGGTETKPKPPATGTAGEHKKGKGAKNHKKGAGGKKKEGAAAGHA